jgi:predicted O-methyltransferase YrrM
VSVKPPDLLAFYENKTQAILRRYGPGPGVHYHTGLFEDECGGEVEASRLRELLVLAQENLLRHAAKTWRLDSLKNREILDVGCGLGGGALFLAQECRARVTALTLIPSHADLVRQFAAQAGVSELVMPVIGDALEVPGDSRFDAAIAIDSSSSFPRAPWFRRLAKVLRPQGRVLIADCFLVDRKYEDSFNTHWCAQIGTLDEYLNAAHGAGFQPETVVDVSGEAGRFWSLSLSLMRSEEMTPELNLNSSASRQASRRMHTMVRDALASGGLRHLLLGFSLTAIESSI